MDFSKLFNASSQPKISNSVNFITLHPWCNSKTKGLHEEPKSQVLGSFFFAILASTFVPLNSTSSVKVAPFLIPSHIHLPPC